jgi:hypothetical protein
MKGLTIRPPKPYIDTQLAAIVGVEEPAQPFSAPHLDAWPIR